MTTLALLIFAAYVVSITYVIKRRYNMTLLEPWTKNSVAGQKWKIVVIPLAIALVSAVFTALTEQVVLATLAAY